MKKNLKTSNTQQHITFRLFGEKTLPVIFAGLSLAFALFYTFNQNTGYAGATYISDSPTSAIRETSTTEDLPNPEAATSVSDVVTKALAFKSSLTTTQQATLQQNYTTTLARRWSNLPCGANCRNGIQFSTLTADQFALALQVIQAAMGTTANEGSDEFNQIRLADAYLGANGGGSGYSSGIYFIAFLNTPSTTGGWMLQFGGHHYGANIAYNQGRVVGATPQFEALEPITFTTGGTTYTPMEQERTALRNMLASFTTTQLTTARLTTTFSDVTMAPGESNGGNGTFPTTKVGIQASTLSSDQKLLVLEAMKPWVKDADDTVATNLLAIYQSELDNTYIAYTGNGTSGSPSTFFTANTNYARIDGPSVWIEFVCQNGVVLSGIHYHSVWRDQVRDYGQNLTLTTPLDATATANDFDGDGKADLALFRPSIGTWYASKSSDSTVLTTQWGISGDKIVPADYNGDGKTDYAVFRNGFWYILNNGGTFQGYQWGATGDTPVPADFDGDNKDDLAVFRNGTWYVLEADGGTSTQIWGLAGDIPVVADYDNDNKADYGVFRNGIWYVLQSSGGNTAIQWGISGDKTVQADYNGDGKADYGVFRAGFWYILLNGGGFQGAQWGATGDLTAPADYDGDGKADLAVFRNGVWYIQRTTAGVQVVNFGLTGDLPTANAFVP